MNRLLPPIPFRKGPRMHRSGFVLLLSVLAASAADAPPRTLDAGTWVRPSFTVVPADVGECPSEEVFLKRAWRRHNAEILLPARPLARLEAAQESHHCEEAREALVRGVSGDWSGLLSMQRFDRNDLPPEQLDTVSRAAGIFPWPEVGPILQGHLADTLRNLLAAKALERSAHLGSSESQNSSVALKMRTQDVTDTELSLLRNSARVVQLRVNGLDVRRSKKGLEFRADFSCALWGFDPVARSFKLEGIWAANSGEVGDAHASGSRVASVSRGFRDRILDLPAFRFTTQILSGHEGNWLNPASNFTTNTAADLRLNRRFRYFENRVDASGNTVAVPAGYGYLDDHSDKDSLWRLRHVGGIRPYSGLVLEEVPGDAWGYVSLTEAGARTTGDAHRPASGDRYVELRSGSPQWELRFGTAAPLGSSHSFLTVDLPFTMGDVHGAVVDDHGLLHPSVPTDLSREQDRQETGPLLGLSLIHI